MKITSLQTLSLTGLPRDPSHLIDGSRLFCSGTGRLVIWLKKAKINKQGRLGLLEVTLTVANSLGQKQSVLKNSANILT